MKTSFSLVALLLLAFYSCNNDVRSGTSYVTSHDGSRIAYQQCGNGDTTILFLHGWCINKEYWADQIRSFCPRYSVVAIDLPGFGASDKNRTDWQFEKYSEDVRAIIRQLKLKNVILVGHSMSGDILLLADNAYPGELLGIVGVDNLHAPGTPMSEEQKRQYEAFYDQFSAEFDSTANRYMRASLFQPATPKAVVDRVMENIFSADSLIAVAVLKELSEVSEREQKLMRGLSHRLYLINSDVMPVQADSLNRYCARGFLTRLIHGSGHYPMVEQPGAFNSALQAVIDSISLQK